MAVKGQKFYKFSNDLKQEIIQKYLDGEGSSRSLCKEHGISYKSIDTMIYRYRHTELKTGKRRGRPK